MMIGHNTAKLLLASALLLGIHGGAEARVRRAVTFKSSIPVPVFAPMTWQQDDVTLTLKNIERIQAGGAEVMRIVLAVRAPWSQATFGAVRLADDTGRVLSRDYSTWNSQLTYGASTEEFDFDLPARAAKRLVEFSGSIDNRTTQLRSFGPYAIDDLRKPTSCDTSFACQLFDVQSGGQPLSYAGGGANDFSDLRLRPEPAGDGRLSLRLFCLQPRRDTPTSIQAVVHGAGGESVQLACDSELNYDASAHLPSDLPYLGAHLMPMTAQEKKHFGVSSGLKVKKVDPTGPAGAGGLRQADVLLELAGRKISTPDDLRECLPLTGSATAAIVRNRKRLSIEIVPGSDPKWQGMPQRAELALKDLKTALGGDGAMSLGFVRLTSVSPAPSGFVPEKVEIQVSSQTEPATTLQFAFKNIPIPARFWK